MLGLSRIYICILHWETGSFDLVYPCWTSDLPLAEESAQLQKSQHINCYIDMSPEIENEDVQKPIVKKLTEPHFWQPPSTKQLQLQA